MNTKDYKVGDFIEYNYPCGGWGHLKLLEGDIEYLDNEDFRPLSIKKLKELYVLHSRVKDKTAQLGIGKVVEVLKTRIRVRYEDKEVAYLDKELQMRLELISTPSYVCAGCGIASLTETQNRGGRTCTFYEGTCDVCDEVKSVTHIRAYNYLK